MLKKVYNTLGIINDIDKMKVGQLVQFQVNITIDNVGATLSIGDLESGIQYSIPFDQILKDIKKSEEKRRFGR